MPLDKVLGFFADNKEVTQAIAKSVPAIMGFHQANKSKKAIIVGASSGIGKALARELVKNNYSVGITGRRDALLLKLKKWTFHSSLSF